MLHFISFLFAFFISPQSVNVEGLDWIEECHDQSVCVVDRISLMQHAELQLGKKYDRTNKYGFDCSGFVQYCYRQIGQEIPRSSKAQYKKGTSITLEEAQQGDVLVFTGRNQEHRNAGHVGLFHHKEDGVIFFIHSANTGGVLISSMEEKYYKKRYLGVVKFED